MPRHGRPTSPTHRWPTSVRMRPQSQRSPEHSARRSLRTPMTPGRSGWPPPAPVAPSPPGQPRTRPRGPRQVADRWAWAAAAASHPRYGATAAAIAADDGPSHDSPTRPDVTELKEAAAEANSIASWSQATAAADMGSDPAPPNMRAELISGGNVEKFMAPTFPGCTEFMAAHQPAVGERRVARRYSAIFAAVCISPE